MYTVGVSGELIAQHYLVGGDWGAENVRHSHPYRVEVQLTGESLDQHNFLTDIALVQHHLDELLAYYRDRTLNDLPGFEGANPSLELFARLLCLQMAERLDAANISSVTLKLWENEQAWASFEVAR